MPPMPTINTELLDRVVENLRTLSGERFQTLIVDHLRFRTGDFVSVAPGPTKGPDGGVDILVRTRSPTEAIETIVFQCKNVNRAVGIGDINDLAITITAESAQQGVIVSPAELSQPAREQIRKLNKGSVILTYLNWTGRLLAETLLEKSPHLLVSLFPILSTDISAPLGLTSNLVPSFEEVGLHAVNAAATADWFFDGFPPSWAQLKAGFDLARPVYVQNRGDRKS